MKWEILASLLILPSLFAPTSIIYVALAHYRYTNPAKSGNFYLRKKPKGSFMPLWFVLRLALFWNTETSKTTKRGRPTYYANKKIWLYTPVLINLHWLPVEHRVIFKLLLFTYKALHGLAPDYLANLLNFYKRVRTLGSSRSINLFVPRSRISTYGDRSFACVSPRLWNKLPDFIRYSETLDSFKTRLKTHLFKIAFNL